MISCVDVSTRRAARRRRRRRRRAARRSPGSGRVSTAACALEPRARARSRSRSAGAPGPRASARPRRSSQRGVGRGDDAGARAELVQALGVARSRLQTTAPSSTSWWPPRYFVALWRTKSAPCSSGRRWIGVAAVASTTHGRRVRGGGLEVGHRQERVRRRLEPDEVDAVGRRRRSGRTRRSAGPSARARGTAPTSRSTRPRRARSSSPGLEEREHDARSSRRCRTRRAAPRRRRARRARARPRRRSGVRSAVVELAGLAVLVRPDRRAVERRRPIGDSTARLGSGWRRRTRPHETRPTSASSSGSSELRDEALHAGTRRRSSGSAPQGKLLARERVEKLLDPGSFVELDRYVRHRESNFGMLERRPYGDAVVTGYGTIFGRKVFVFSQDFTVFGGCLSRGLRREDLQGDGPGREVRLPRDRDQRLGRRAHPGGRRLARRLRRDLLAQRPVLGRHPADLASSWARAPAAPSTRPRSPTSCSWSRERRTCSSPAPTS